MKNAIASLSPPIRTGLADFLDRMRHDIGSISGWTDDVIDRLADYAGRGKLIRGSLVPFGEMLFGAGPSNGSFDLGVAMELLQTFLLIHDDIMDDDDTRRGGPAIHAQFRNEAPSGGANGEYGVAQGICVGDVAAFLATHRVATADLPDSVLLRVQRVVGLEIVRVGLAQMQDVYHGLCESATVEAILDVYTYKTGRYTFSLPLMLGAFVADQEDRTIDDLAELGESLGRIFQIRDDELGVYGDEPVTGKPSGSDVREDKLTLLRALFFERCPDASRYRHLFGKRDLTSEEIDLLRAAFSSCGAKRAVEEIVDREAAHSRTIIERLAVSEEGRARLFALLDYNLERNV